MLLLLLLAVAILVFCLLCMKDRAVVIPEEVEVTQKNEAPVDTGVVATPVEMMVCLTFSVFEAT